MRAVAAAITLLTVCTIVLVLSPAMAGQESKRPRRAPVRIEIDAGAASPHWDASRAPAENRKPDWTPPSARVWLDSIAMLLEGDEIRLIRVEKYSASQFSSSAAVRQTLQRLWNTEVDAPQQYIPWAEGNTWSIECRIELKGGKSARLITDGWRSCYQNAEGYRWFFRGTVAEAEKLRISGR